MVQETQTRELNEPISNPLAATTNALLIRPNPIFREWFSQPAPQEHKQPGASVFE